MAIFLHKIELDEDQKEFIKSRLKSYLQKNDMVSARYVALKECYDEDGKCPVLGFLLQQLGEKVYFNGSDKIYTGEFCFLPLLSIDIPNNIKNIGDSAFYGTSLKGTLVVPENVDYIGYESFTGCSKLTEIQIPQSYIGYYKKIMGFKSFDEALVEIRKVSDIPGNVKLTTY